MKKLLLALSLLIVLPGLTSCNKDQGSKVCVAYFSYTGVTKGVAESLAKIADATLYEIVPEEAYGDDTMNYYDENARAYKEQFGTAPQRPAIKKSFKGAKKYDVLLIGFPVWYGKAPRVILTFLEEYAHEGQTVIPFCTSDSSTIDSSETELKTTFPAINWRHGDRLNDKTAVQLQAWFESFGCGL